MDSTTSSDSSTISFYPPVSTITVPYRWQRVVVTNAHSVYYISPSGRVLLDLTDLYYYLSSKHTCKCYLEPVLEMAFLDIFNFDPNVISISTVQSEKNFQAVHSECEERAKRVKPHILNAQVQRTIAYLSEEMINFEEARMVMNRTQKVDNVNLYTWMMNFDWERIRIMPDGRKVSYFLENYHLIHITKELTMTGQLDNVLHSSLDWKTFFYKKVQDELDDKENEDINSSLISECLK